ncbi:protein MON2 [Marchantia polymorpha subsp. ruderalis]|uniref:Protein MON2 homolog n=2 Tax=Marchantia polymorpha TaxID=3197 RepID=A0AAF6BNR1_MARPO|nr:hypothetical protein MARPO_0167s0007 [Marchantia polymorpha]BBN13645.1 hypothetical protein Mp_6g05240 [Marchantia polymorpha subsp. ruderalis]|eukprot:PTQ28314.1 hypothetical protein MARPO_0167s0007 [Marchantia polymorpha]
MAFVAVLEADLRALSAEARRKYPLVKDAAEHAILKLRSQSDPAQLAKSDDIVRTFLLACEPKNVKLSALGLACMQKLIAHDAVAPTALAPILSTLKEHSEMSDEAVQLKILQTILTILQSQLHPQDEESMAVLLGICLRLLSNNRNADSVHSTAAATLRQAVALIFDRVITAEKLPVLKPDSRSRNARSNSVSGDVSRNIAASKAVEAALKDESCTVTSKSTLTQAGRLGLRLFEDLTSLAGGGTASWLHVSILQRTFALDMLEYVLSHYVPVFRKLGPYQQVLRGQVCSLLMTSMRTSGDHDGEGSEPAYRRLVLRTVANVTRLYSTIVTTECEVFLSMLIKSADLELPLWHRIMVLEVLRGFCVEARMLHLLFQTFDMKPENTSLVTDLVQALANVVRSIQLQEVNEDTLNAVAAMFNSKAKGVEWTMDHEASGAAVIVASEAHAITLAVEGLLGVVFTVAAMTDEALDEGELDSPRLERASSDMKLVGGTGKGGELASTCSSLVQAVWRTLLESLSLMLSRSQGEAIVLEILKGYQAFTQSCGVLRSVHPRDAFLSSLCKFALAPQDEGLSASSLLLAAGRRFDPGSDQREGVVLTVKNVQALRTLFNISHRLNCVLDSSWTMVLETLAVLDRLIHSPHATTQEVSSYGARGIEGRQATDFQILSSLDAQLFESSAIMSTSAVCALLGALRQVSNNSLVGVVSGLGSAASGSSSSSGITNAIGGATLPKIFGVDRMLTVLTHNLHRADLLWDQVSAHLFELTLHESSQVRAVALDALDRSICTVLPCERIRQDAAAFVDATGEGKDDDFGQFVSTVSVSELGTAEKTFTSPRRSRLLDSKATNFRLDTFECAVVAPLSSLYNYGHSLELRCGSLKILLHVLERHGEKLYHSWPSILELLRAVANTSEKDIVPLGFQNVRVIMNDGMLSIPAHALDMCVEVAGAYGAQKTDVNISLTAIGLLWTVADFCARGVDHGVFDGGEGKTRHNSQADVSSRQASPRRPSLQAAPGLNRLDSKAIEHAKDNVPKGLTKRADMDYDGLLLAVYGVIQGLGTDERPEVRNSAIRTLFQSVSGHGYKLSMSMWRHCLWNLMFPLVETVRHLAAISSKDEIGEELGTQGGKTVHMLVHHSRNTAQKQWDETIVLVLGGLSRLIKPYFQFFQSMQDFEKGWETVLKFIKESVVEGSKEVGLAAVSSLHNILLSQLTKGILPSFYFNTAFATYETIVSSTRTNENRVATKARQELVQSLGELYSQGSSMFESKTYLQLLTMVDVCTRYPLTKGETSQAAAGVLLPLHRTVLEVLPLLKPLDEKVQHLWPLFLRQILSYLPGGDQWIGEHCIFRSADLTKSSHESISAGVSVSTALTMNGHGVPKISPRSRNSSAKDLSAVSASPDFSAIPSVFCERAVVVLVQIYLVAPSSVKVLVQPDVIASLGRCMATRRDFPGEELWRAAVGSFNQVVQESLIPDSLEFAQSPDGKGHSRHRFWNQLADVYENFLVGACGRVFSSTGDGTDTQQADELLEASVLDVLCEKVLNNCQDAPNEVVARLVEIIDRCGARISLLPLPSVSLLPIHCGRFSLACLQKLFKLCAVQSSMTESSSQVMVSRVAVSVLVGRCKTILCQFRVDEKETGGKNLPLMRIDEVKLVLQELDRLQLHPLTAGALDLPITRRELSKPSGSSTQPSNSGSETKKNSMVWIRGHILLLFTPLCDLVGSQVSGVSDLLVVLLRSLGTELGL